MGWGLPTWETFGSIRYLTDGGSRVFRLIFNWVHFKGFTSIIASSLAVLKSSAALLHRPAFEHLHQTMNFDEPITMPTVAMTILTGGKFAPGGLRVTSYIVYEQNKASGIVESTRAALLDFDTRPFRQLFFTVAGTMTGLPFVRSCANFPEVHLHRSKA